ncbi:MAG: sugar phosphate isomerase/epimerase family protein [Methanocorpusculum sp.]|nr:sugar phosphate isomerase/epimerase family protein [Methanocorpusculum sp.]
MLEIGISSNCCLDLPLADALERLSQHTAFVEILSSGNHSLFDYGEAAASYPLRYSVHCPVSDGNIAEPNEKIRCSSVEVLAETAEAADKINAEVLIIHPGYCLEPALFAASKQALLRSVEEIGKLQEEYTVHFAVENMGSLPCLHFRTPEFLRVVREAGLGFCLDTGHASLNGVLDAFCRGRPDHLHLHDNDGIQDLHGACGSGTIDFDAVRNCGAKSAVIECMTWGDTIRSLQYFGMK